jgi:hypothetical protein
VEARRIWSHLLLSGRVERPADLPQPHGTKGRTPPNTIDDATMQPCGADCPASLYHRATDVSVSPSSCGFSTAY